MATTIHPAAEAHLEAATHHAEAAAAHSAKAHELTTQAVKKSSPTQQR
jgi:hypothetical protein